MTSRFMLSLLSIALVGLMWSSLATGADAARAAPAAEAAPAVAADAPIRQEQPPPPDGLPLQGETLESLEKRYEGQTPPEGARMYMAILRGSKMGSGEGWFGPAESKYSWEWLAARQSVDPEKSISREEFQGPAEVFVRLDRNKNESLDGSDFDWSDDNPWVEYSYLCNRLFRKIEPGGDGRLTRDEWLAFFDKAAEGRDGLTSAELRDAWLKGMSMGFLPGDEPNTERLLQGMLAGDLGSLQEGPAVGQPAPDFTLRTAKGETTVHLADVLGRRPVVLVFGNFTCGPFRSMYPDVELVRDRFRDQADFYGVYVREAHPTDGWHMQSNDRVGVQTEQPKTYGQRCTIAGECEAKLKATIPWLVDDANDSVGHAYSGMPARLYVIGTDGTVAYQGGRGPFGFKVGEMEQALAMTLLDEALPSPAPSPTAEAADAPETSFAAPPAGPRTPLLSNDEAWKSLPESSSGAGSPLPSWARALAGLQPYTTAAVLELDAACRTTDQFSARERGLIRLAVAQVNRSPYGIAYGEAELRGAGASDEELVDLSAGRLDGLGPEERRLFEYARQASIAARELTDAQVGSLRTQLGDERLVGLVLLTAYANFQDRLVLALNLPVEEAGPVAPIAVSFAALHVQPAGSGVVQADRPTIPSESTSMHARPSAWDAFPFDDLQGRLEQQRARAPRVAVPSWEELTATVPPGLYNRKRPLRIDWSRLVIGRQPILGTAWIRCLRTFGAEANQDRAFEESVFWVVTREMQCFYCMGHCEMLMEVGGLTPPQISERTRRMADGNWSDFAPWEREAFALASKMTRTPWAVSDDDLAGLRETLGPERTVDLIWWIARCQFMTKVSDTFQLRLERENVFQDFEPAAVSGTAAADPTSATDSSTPAPEKAAESSNFPTAPLNSEG